MMNNKINDLLNEVEQYNEYLINNSTNTKLAKILLKNKSFYCLTESDFYPPYDNRVLKSYIEDIDNENNFANYCEGIFELLEEEGYYD